MDALGYAMFAQTYDAGVDASLVQMQELV